MLVECLVFIIYLWLLMSVVYVDISLIINRSRIELEVLVVLISSFYCIYIKKVFCMFLICIYSFSCLLIRRKIKMKQLYFYLELKVTFKKLFHEWSININLVPNKITMVAHACIMGRNLSLMYTYFVVVVVHPSMHLCVLFIKLIFIKLIFICHIEFSRKIGFGKKIIFILIRLFFQHISECRPGS